MADTPVWLDVKPMEGGAVTILARFSNLIEISTINKTFDQLRELDAILLKFFPMYEIVNTLPPSINDGTVKQLKSFLYTFIWIKRLRPLLSAWLLDAKFEGEKVQAVVAHDHRGNFSKGEVDVFKGEVVQIINAVGTRDSSGSSSAMVKGWKVNGDAGTLPLSAVRVSPSLDTAAFLNQSSFIIPDYFSRDEIFTKRRKSINRLSKPMKLKDHQLLIYERPLQMIPEALQIETKPDYSLPPRVTKPVAPPSSTNSPSPFIVPALTNASPIHTDSLLSAFNNLSSSSPTKAKGSVGPFPAALVLAAEKQRRLSAPALTDFEEETNITEITSPHISQTAICTNPRSYEFSLDSLDGYDELTDHGFTVERSGGDHSLDSTHQLVDGGDTIEVEYVACIWDGAQTNILEFESSAGCYFTIGRGEVISGLDHGIKRLPVGEKGTIIIAPEKGYGLNTAKNGLIPKHSHLVYFITVLRSGFHVEAADAPVMDSESIDPSPSAATGLINIRGKNKGAKLVDNKANEGSKKPPVSSPSPVMSSVPPPPEDITSTSKLVSTPAVPKPPVSTIKALPPTPPKKKVPRPPIPSTVDELLEERGSVDFDRKRSASATSHSSTREEGASVRNRSSSATSRMPNHLIDTGGVMAMIPAISIPKEAREIPEEESKSHRLDISPIVKRTPPPLPISTKNIASSADDNTFKLTPPAIPSDDYDSTAPPVSDAIQLTEVPAGAIKVPKGAVPVFGLAGGVVSPHERNTAPSTTTVARPISATCLNFSDITEYMSYESLKSMNSASDGIDLRAKELYLSDEDFQHVFEIPKEQWSKLPKWKKNAEKKRVGLF